MKDIEWLGSSLKDLQALKTDLKRRVGFELDTIQRGFQPSDFKPMPSVGSGVNEIRVTGEDGIARCFYATKFGNKVLVIHVFEKKSQKTPQTDIELGKKRLTAFLKELKR